jgi:hypothetical protein
MAVMPGDGALLLSTEDGFYRVPRAGGRAQVIEGEVRGVGPAPIAMTRQLAVAAVGPHELVGSGHPDRDGVRPYNLGLLASEDTGRTWAPRSLVGQADLHNIRVSGGRLYAYDLAHDRFVMTTTSARTWTTRPAPGLMLDLAVDPADPERVVASTDRGVLVSADEGRTWRPTSAEAGTLLAWPRADALYLVDDRGVVRRSRDGGASGEVVGTLGSAPERVVAAADGTLYVAASDRTVRVSEDGGRSWDVRLRLRG